MILTPKLAPPSVKAISRGKIQASIKPKEMVQFIAVHGVSHGAWVYYKVKPLVEAAGHKFTAVNMAASGNNPKQLEELLSLHDYTKPLLDVLEAVPEGEKVVLIGHSGGGMSAALGMEKFPEKIAAGVFICAIMPDTKNRPSFVLEKYTSGTPPEAWMDSTFGAHGTDPQITTMNVGPEFLKKNLYQLCPVEDYTLATLSVRPGSLFIEDLLRAEKFTDEGLGSVKRVYVVCPEDHCIPADFQRWLIENNPVTEVKEIEGADHMPMFSKPAELAKCLIEIGETYA